MWAAAPIRLDAPARAFGEAKVGGLRYAGAGGCAGSDGEWDNRITANGDEGGGVLACALRKRGQRFWPIMILSGQAQMADAGRISGLRQGQYRQRHLHHSGKFAGRGQAEGRSGAQ